MGGYGEIDFLHLFRIGSFGLRVPNPLKFPPRRGHIFVFVKNAISPWRNSEKSCFQAVTPAGNSWLAEVPAKFIS